jgi:dTDP-4-amino-4,6-dideoxygalactose transaminase
MRISLVDQQAQYRTIKPEISTTIEDALEGIQLFLGPQSQAFEYEFAQYCRCRYRVGLSTRTDALTLALRACDSSIGDEVITVANTFIATVEAIALAGAPPIFVDVDPETYTMDWRQQANHYAPLAGARK